jgi:hypothetical protein
MEALSPEDLKRANSCDNYKLAKRIMQSCEDHSEYEVGGAVFIKHKRDNTYAGSGYGALLEKYKYIIVHKDGGFLFAKRILATGKPGVQITCLTIEFPSDSYDLEVDEDFLDSVLLDTDYDPASNAKSLAKKKEKASRINNKNRINFALPIGAWHYLNNLQKGEFLWGAETSFGNQITKYEVSSVEQYVPDPKQQVYRSWKGTESPQAHRSHINENLLTGVRVTLIVAESENKYTNGKTLYFYHITNNDKYRNCSVPLYTVKPTKAEDIIL